MSPGKAIEAAPRVDLELGSLVAQKLSRALENVQKHSQRLREKRDAGQELSSEDEAEMQRLLEHLRYVENRQTALKEAVEEDLVKRTRLHAEQEARRKQAMTIGREKPPAKLHMQELRDMNQIELTQDDRDKRWNDANAVKKIVPSGGLVGFRVADDLLVKDYNNDDNQQAPNPWDGKNRDD